VIVLCLASDCVVYSIHPILQGMSKKRLTVKATREGLVLAQNALKRLGGTQLSLAKKLTGSVGRSTIQKFFQ